MATDAFFRVSFGDPPSAPFGPFCEVHAHGFSRLAKLATVASWDDGDASECVWCNAQSAGRQVFAQPIDKHGRPIAPVVVEA